MKEGMGMLIVLLLALAVGFFMISAAAGLLATVP